MNSASWIVNNNKAFQLMRLFFGMGSRAGLANSMARQPYTGEELRVIRKKNGVGRPPIVNLDRIEKHNAKVSRRAFSTNDDFWKLGKVEIKYV